jgi:hypothetical protein
VAATAGGQALTDSLGERLRKARVLSQRAGTAGEAQAATAAAERMLARLRRDIAFCRDNRRMLRNSERTFLSQLRDNREPTPADAMRITAIADAIRRDPRCRQSD